MILKMSGESKIIEVFKILNLIILLEGVTYFYPQDFMFTYIHVCSHAASSVGHRDIKHI